MGDRIHMITRAGLENLIKKKINGHSLPDGWKEEVDEYLNVKKGILEKERELPENSIQNIEGEIREILRIKEWLEKKPVEIPLEIKSQGFVARGIVIIPISPWKYVYNICGLKGITQLNKMPETNKYYLEIGETGHQIFLTDKPIQEFCYDLPDQELIKSWVKGDTYSLTTNEIWTHVDKYVRLFIDIPEVFYNVMKLFIMQTWLKEVTDTVFYVCIMGAWGSGKSAILETIHYVSKNSLLGQPSKAFLARMVDKQNITVCFDELDTVVGREEDTDLLSIFRLGYRRGQKYPIMNKDLEPIFFDVFGPKAYTVKTVSEGALLQRALPITTSESTEATLPAINTIKPKIAKLLRNKLWLWYLDNIIIYVDIDYIVDYNSIDSSSRESIYSFLCANIGTTDVTEQRYGRNAELGFAVAKLAFLLKVDLGRFWATNIFEAKKEAEEDLQEVNDIQILRDILMDKYKELASLPAKEGWRTEDGCVKVSHKEIFKIFTDKMKKEKFLGTNNKDFAGYLRELGFDKGDRKSGAKRKIRIQCPGEAMGPDGWPVRLTLVYIPYVIKRLGLKEVNPVSETKEERVG